MAKCSSSQERTSRLSTSSSSPTAVRGLGLWTLFHRATGLSPNRYLQSRRIALACRMLRQTDLSLTDIAMAIGVANARVLHRLFRSWTGTTPLCWRQTVD